MGSLIEHQRQELLQHLRDKVLSLSPSTPKKVEQHLTLLMVSASQTRPVGESHQSGILSAFIPLCHPDLIAAISYIIH